MYQPKITKFQVGKETITIETGRMAKQAAGSVLISCGGTSVLCTVCYGQTMEDLDFVPLSVEYNEKYYAAGKIPGGFLKRESKPKDKEILVSRLIDRPIRPLLMKEFGREVQLVPTVLSTDQINPPDVLSIIGSSVSLAISEIPFNGPVAGVRIVKLGEDYLVNPSFNEISKSSIDIIVAGTKEGVTMVEGGADEVEEEDMIKAIDIARNEISKICLQIEEFVKEVGKQKISLNTTQTKLKNHDLIYPFSYSQLEKAIFVKGKAERGTAISETIKELKEKFKNDILENEEKHFSKLLDDIQRDILRKSILDKNIRVDGRNSNQIRPITCEISVLPKVHGSALFTRGETQALAVATLGTADDEVITDDIEGDKREKFMLHYNFPPFSVGETGRLGTGRREIGHGHLAFRAVSRVLLEDNFPYTVRVVSEVLESNGSSSMATVCGSSLALMDAGVPLRRPVAGIAMGLITEGERFCVLSDILGEEDHLGDMDFKVAGTQNGITAFQMDIKISNVSSEVLNIALKQAKDGRMHILGVMNQVIENSNEEVSENAPRVIRFNVPVEKIGGVIGSGGKNIKSISERNNVKITVGQDGEVQIHSPSNKDAMNAKEEILASITDLVVGEVYEGKVVRILDFGAFIELPGKKEGLCHISKLSSQRVAKVEDVLQLEQVLKFRVIGIDRQQKISLAVDGVVIKPGFERQDRSDNQGRDQNRRYGNNNNNNSRFGAKRDFRNNNENGNH